MAQLFESRNFVWSRASQVLGPLGPENMPKWAEKRVSCIGGNLLLGYQLGVSRLSLLPDYPQDILADPMVAGYEWSCMMHDGP